MKYKKIHNIRRDLIMSKRIKATVSLFLVMSMVLMTPLVSSANTIDVSYYEANGYEKAELDNGMIAYYEVIETENTNPLLKATSYKSKTATGKFYLTSSGQTVAEYSLSATFSYNGVDTVGQTGHRVWIGNYASGGWSGTAVDGYNWISPQYMYINGYYDLYKNGDFNNSATISMYCDHKGNITVEHY